MLFMTDNNVIPAYIEQRQRCYNTVYKRRISVPLAGSWALPYVILQPRNYVQIGCYILKIFNDIVFNFSKRK
jgi:hypothetical protein